MEYKGILEGFEKEIKETMVGHIKHLIHGVSQTIEKPPRAFEEKLKQAFVQGMMNEIGNELKCKLESNESQELEEDVSIIANQLSRIDTLLSQYGLENTNFTDICAVSLERWMLSMKDRCYEVAHQIIQEENWEVPSDGVRLFLYSS